MNVRKKSSNYDQPFKKSNGKKRKNEEDTGSLSGFFMEELKHQKSPILSASSSSSTAPNSSTATNIKRRRKKDEVVTKSTVSFLGSKDVFVPKEVLLQIFSFLDFKTIVSSVVQTCKDWNEFFSKENLDTNRELIWKHHKFIDLPKCTSKKMLDKIEDCYGKHLLQFTNVQCIDLSFFECIFSYLKQATPEDVHMHLESLTSICQTEPVFSRSFQPLQTDNLVSIHTLHIDKNSQLLKAFIMSDFVSHLQFVIIENCSLHYGLWIRLFKFCSQFKELTIRNCVELSSRAIQILVANANQELRKLDLSGMSIDTYDLENSFTNLKILHLEGGTKGIPKLHKDCFDRFENLEELYLQNNTSLSNETGLLEMLLSIPLKCLRVVNIEGCVEHFSEQSLRKLLHKIETIRKITVTQHGGVITYEQVREEFFGPREETKAVRVFQSNSNSSNLFI